MITVSSAALIVGSSSSSSRCARQPLPSRLVTWHSSHRSTCPTLRRRARRASRCNGPGCSGQRQLCSEGGLREPCRRTPVNASPRPLRQRASLRRRNGGISGLWVARLGYGRSQIGLLSRRIRTDGRCINSTPLYLRSAGGERISASPGGISRMCATPVAEAWLSRTRLSARDRGTWCSSRF
jgi:hypothetical protein